MYFPPNDLVASGSLTAIGQSATISGMNGQNTVTFQVTGTWTGQLGLEVSTDGTNYVAASVIINLASKFISQAVNSGQVGIWQANVSGCSSIRVRMLSASTGTAVVTMRASYAAGAVSEDNAPAIGVQTAATSVAVIPTSDVTSDFVQNAVALSTINFNMMNGTVLGSAVASLAGLTNLSATGFQNVTYVPFRSFSCQLIGGAGITSGQVIFEGSNDNVTFFPMPVFDEKAGDGLPIRTAITIAASTNYLFTGKINTIYIRCRISSAFTGGTISAVTRFIQTDLLPALVPSKSQPQSIFRTTFAQVLASTWDTSFWTQIGAVGTGQAISQSAGNGVITSGTTANQETTLRSIRSFIGSFLLRAQVILSQRIAQNNFFVELVDIVGDGLAITVNSATSVTVTIQNNPFTAANVGQSMYIGTLTGFTGVTSIPGRYAIASVAGNNVTFTVAAWATGAGNTGTCSLFGWNYHQLLYDSTTATQMKYDAQRRGWASGATTATINTTASPGHMAVMGSEDGDAFLSDQLVASAATLPLTRRASRVINIAEEATPLYLQVRCVNGTSNPATTTTFTVGTVSVENYSSQQVTIANAKAQSGNTATPVTVENAPGVVINSGTVTTVSSVTNVAAVTPGVAAGSLGKAEDAAHTTGDTGVAQWGVRQDVPPATPATSATGDYGFMAINKWNAGLVANFEKTAKTFSSSLSLAAVATASDIAILPGNGTNTVYITKIIVSGIQTTAGSVLLQLIKRSTANAGGTASTPTPVPHDSADTAVSAPSFYTANPTPGTGLGNVRAQYIALGSATAVAEPVIWEFNDKGKPIVLSGTAQGLAVNLNGATVTGGNFTVTFEWFEI